MTVGGGLGIGPFGISGRGSSTAYHSSGTGDYGKVDLRKYAEQQKAKKEAKRKSAISSRATDIRVESARDFQQRMSDEKQNPGLLHGVRRRVLNLFRGKPKIPTRKAAVERATKEVDDEEAAEKAANRKEFAKIREQHGLGGGRKTKKHRNKKNNTKRRR